MNSEILVLLVAVLLDLVYGEPPGRIHPVVWMGRLAGFLEDHAPASHRRLYGALMVLIAASSFTAAGAILSHTEHPLAILASAYLLKSTFSLRMLVSEALRIQRCLQEGCLEAAIGMLKSFVSRDTTGFDSEKVCSAVIESVSENYVDSILSPLFYYALFGLPGALAYKVVNTLDSMIGYTTPEYADLGFPAARLDDVLNYIPARLSALFISLASFSTTPLQAALREHRATPSPNSGWPMAAAACALDVALEKPGVYRLNQGGVPCKPHHIGVAAGLIQRVTIVTITAAIAFLWRTHTTSWINF